MRAILAIGAAAGLLLAPGCTPAEQAEVHEDVRGVRQQLDRVTEGAQKAAEKAALEGMVKSALRLRKGLDARQIQVESRDGVIVLKGDVPSREQAELAEQVARETQGVKEVENELMVRIPAKELRDEPVSDAPAPEPGAGAPSEPVEDRGIRPENPGLR